MNKLSQGFKSKSFHDIKKNLEDAFLQEIDPGLRFTPDTIAGVLTGIMANELSKTWESLYELYHSQDPFVATGRALDVLCSLTGTARKKAIPSSARALVRLAGNTTLPKGTLVQVEGNSEAIFQTLLDVKNDSNQEAVLEVDLEAQSPGEIYAPAQKLTKILTPVSGFLGITNTHDAVLGCLDETDEELKLRRFLELRATGSGTLEAIKSHILALESVQAVHIEEAEHSFTAYVMGGDEALIKKVLLEQKPLGVKAIFARPSIVKTSLKITIKVKPMLTDDELKKLKEAILAETKKLKLGQEFYPSQKLYPVLFAKGKVLDVIKIELTPAVKEIKAHELVEILDIMITQILEEAV